MVLLSAEQKAVKRKEIAERRQRNALAAKLLPIAYNQARIVANSSGIDYDVIVGESLTGLAKAMAKGNSETPGYYSLVRKYCHGYCLNYLRDKSRAVRLPRQITLCYLAEQSALRNSTAFRYLSDKDKALQLGVSLELLLESRSAISMYSSDLDKVDACWDEAKADTVLQDAASTVLEVLTAGIDSLASAGKVDRSAITDKLYKSLQIVIEHEYQQRQST